ncbi:MAG: dihydropteroate synthase, partial [Bacteroidota bacterium]
MLANSLTNFSKTLSCNGKIVLVQKPVVMGILNITPDSFYENSRVGDDKKYLSVAEKMIQDGAAIIDIGGQSTRPNAELISVDDELKRVLPVVKNIQKHFPDVLISVDTFYSKVAQATIDCGANIINDISGGSMDTNMFAT